VDRYLRTWGKVGVSTSPRRRVADANAHISASPSERTYKGRWHPNRRRGVGAAAAPLPSACGLMSSGPSDPGQTTLPKCPAGAPLAMSGLSTERAVPGMRPPARVSGGRVVNIQQRKREIQCKANSRGISTLGECHRIDNGPGATTFVWP
jgi:hypothetical protein